MAPSDYELPERQEIRAQLMRPIEDGGVLYLDDYGSWMGARQAVDQYFSEHPSPILLHRLSGGSRIGVKPQASHAGT